MLLKTGHLLPPSSKHWMLVRSSESLQFFSELSWVITTTRSRMKPNVAVLITDELSLRVSLAVYEQPSAGRNNLTTNQNFAQYQTLPRVFYTDASVKPLFLWHYLSRWLNGRSAQTRSSMAPFIQNSEAVYGWDRLVLNGECKRLYGKQDGNEVKVCKSRDRWTIWLWKKEQKRPRASPDRHTRPAAQLKADVSVWLKI